MVAEPENKFKFFRRNKNPKLAQEHFGKKAELKVFYEYTPEGESASWVEWAPPALPQPKKVKFEGYAIQLYKKPEQTPGLGSVVKYYLDYITIQSPYLLKELQPHLEKHGVICHETYANIYRPFAPLFYERDRIYGLSQSADDSDTREHLSLLCQFMDDNMSTTIDDFEQLEKENHITHDLLWALFPADTWVIAKENGYDQGYKVSWSSYRYESESRWALRELEIVCEFVRFNGLQYGYSERNFIIPYFEGKKDILKLKIYPYAAEPNAPALREQMKERGRRVLDFQDIHYMQYGGLAVQRLRPSYNEVVKDFWGGDVHGRIIIDAYKYAKENESLRHWITPLQQYADDETGRFLSASAKAGSSSGHDGADQRRLTKDQQEMNKQIVLKDEENLFLMCPILDGFSLVSKFWLNFNVDMVSEIELSDDAFHHLVLPQKTKHLALSLVESHKKHGSVSDDVIKGKGQGLIIMLSGLPGTGKTLMAEASESILISPNAELNLAVADKTRSPLYYVDAAELGSSPAAISLNFAEIMSYAADWNALVLLDEADVYLRARTRKRDYNDEIVTAFLRQLEYFKGILFFTTNLFDSIDSAVESRIHVHIMLPPHQNTARATIWANFLGRLTREICEISPAEVEELGQWKLNGRQIKNVLRMALSLAREENSPISLAAVEDMIGLTCPKSVKEAAEASKVNGIPAEQSKSNGSADKSQHLLDFDGLL